MTKLTVCHWVITDTQDPKKLDTSSPSGRYDGLRESSSEQEDSRVDRLQSYPFNSRPFTIEVIAHQLYNTSPNKNTESVLDKLESDGFYGLRTAELPTVLSVSKSISKARDPVITRDSYANIIKAPPKNTSTPATEANKPTNNPPPAQPPKPDLLFNARGQGSYEVKTVKYVLDFHIPPSQISYDYGHELGRNKARAGWVIERWGERLVNIEVEGSSGMFFHEQEGLTRVHANATYGYFELMNLLQVYRNNGLSYDPKFGTVYTVGEVRIYYGDLSWTGSFDSFDIKESADSPYKFNYSFSFVSRGQIGDVNVRGHYIETSKDVSRYGINSQEMLSRVLAGYKSRKIDRSLGIPDHSSLKEIASSRGKNSGENGAVKLFFNSGIALQGLGKDIPQGTKLETTPPKVQRMLDKFQGPMNSPI